MSSGQEKESSSERGKNATLRCLDDNKRIVCRTSERSQREPSSYPPAIYQLKHCQLCPAANDRDIHFIKTPLSKKSINLWWCSSHFTATLIGPLDPYVITSMVNYVFSAASVALVPKCGTPAGFPFLGKAFK
ncbi:hypothetical protein BCV71DRAFT_237364 [Rhizopus microsporus]|uniref:Uncharacterized protein n=1 Tax=Rhizopus microsporus TaxID=58291 RepID=A0A1X0RUI4_RHIZD|nr:hypothetical protein BCV71DRAFT_237364 [Rhizopus microsporus]